MPNNSQDTLALLEAIANRRLLAATTPKDRCLRALALMAIRAYRRQAVPAVGTQANAQMPSGEAATAMVTPSPVGARGASTPPFPHPRPVFSKQRRAGDSLDLVTLPPEITALTGCAAECQPGGRASEPKTVRVVNSLRD